MKIKDYFKTKEPLIFFLMIFFLISPGFVYFFFWHRELFIQLDWVKTVLLSMSMLIPISFLNTIALVTFEKKQPSNKGQELVDAFTMASIFTGLSTLVGLALFYVTGYSVAVILVCCEAVLLAVMFIEARNTIGEK